MANKSFLIGRLTQDPTSATLDSGHSYCRFTIAVNRPYSKDRDQTTDFINIVAWDNTAQNCVKYLAKGSQVAVVGSIQTGSYERDGIKRNTFEIRAEQVEFLFRPQTDDGEAKPTQQTATRNPSQPAQHRQSSIDDLQEVDDSDMPF